MFSINYLANYNKTIDTKMTIEQWKPACAVLYSHSDLLDIPINLTFSSSLVMRIH